MIVAAASNVGSRTDGPEISIKMEQHNNSMEVAGEVLIGRLSKEEFIILDKRDGLDLKDSVVKAKEFMRARGCKITDLRTVHGLRGEETGACQSKQR